MAELGALQALNRGDASAAQQQRALDWMIKSAGMIGGLSYGDSDRMTSFNEGRRFVAICLIEMVKTPFDVMKKSATDWGKKDD